MCAIEMETNVITIIHTPKISMKYLRLLLLLLLYIMWNNNKTY